MNPTRTIAVADGLVPASEVCRRLHVNDQTLRAICEWSRFMQPEVRPGPGGGKRYFREAAIARYLELERPIDQVNSPDRDRELVRRYRMARASRRSLP